MYSLSHEDIDAVNNWHWPLTYEGCLDIFAPVECDTPEKVEFRHYKLANRFKYAYNTYRKYRNIDEGWQSHTHWLIEVIAKTADLDLSVIPEPLHKVIPYCKRWSEITKEGKCTDEAMKLRSKIYKIIDLYIDAHPVSRGRPQKQQISAV